MIPNSRGCATQRQNTPTLCSTWAHRGMRQQWSKAQQVTTALGLKFIWLTWPWHRLAHVAGVWHLLIDFHVLPACTRPSINLRMACLELPWRHATSDADFLSPQCLLGHLCCPISFPQERGILADLRPSARQAAYLPQQTPCCGLICVCFISNMSPRWYLPREQTPCWVQRLASRAAPGHT